MCALIKPQRHTMLHAGRAKELATQVAANGDTIMMTQGFKKATLTAMIATFGLAGCVENTGRTSQQDAGIAVGGLLGAVAGGLAGTQVGKGRGRTTAIIAGSILGGLAGGAIGNRLGQRDEQLAQQATQQTLASAPVNQPVRWQNPQSGAYGDVVATTPVYQQPVQVAYQPTAASYTTTAPVQQVLDCRDYKQTIFVDNQRYETAVGTACRQADGSWRIQS